MVLRGWTSIRVEVDRTGGPEGREPAQRAPAHGEGDGLKVPTLEWPPEETIRWAVGRFSPRLLVSSSFGNPEGTVLLHMVSRVDPSVPVAWVNTGFLFSETLAFQAEFSRRMGLRVVELVPRWTPEGQASRFGDALWDRDPDLCCQIRKVDPLFEALQEYDAWMTGIRRGQTAARAEVAVVEQHRLPARHPSQAAKTITKINPLARWSRQQVWAYLEEHALPYNPLLDQGYPSLGCVQCTRRVAPPGTRVDDRSGRWWGSEKTECGLHTGTRSAPAPPGRFFSAPAGSSR